MGILGRSMARARGFGVKQVTMTLGIAVIIMMTTPGMGTSAYRRSVGGLVVNDCLSKSIPDKNNVCGTLSQYLLNVDNPTKSGCTKYMASHGFGANTVAPRICSVFLNDR